MDLQRARTVAGQSRLVDYLDGVVRAYFDAERQAAELLRVFSTARHEVEKLRDEERERLADL